MSTPPADNVLMSLGSASVNCGKSCLEAGIEIEVSPQKFRTSYCRKLMSHFQGSGRRQLPDCHQALFNCQLSQRRLLCLFWTGVSCELVACLIAHFGSKFPFCNARREPSVTCLITSWMVNTRSTLDRHHDDCPLDRSLSPL